MIILGPTHELTPSAAERRRSCQFGWEAPVNLPQAAAPTESQSRQTPLPGAKLIRPGSPQAADEVYPPASLMKKPSASKKSLTTAKSKPDGLTTLVTEVRQLIQSARRGVSTVVDT